MVSAILLAAGESRRMGRLKPLLPFGSVTVIETCLEMLLGSNVDEVVIVLGHRAEDIQRRTQSFPVRCVVNSEYRTGMTSSVKAGVRVVSPAAVAVVIALVDQPLIPSTLVNQLIETYLERGDPIVVPEYGGRLGHPILIDLRLRDDILAIDPGIGLRQLIRRHWTEVVKQPVDTDAVLHNMNTWDEYQEMLRRLPPYAT